MKRTLIALAVALSAASCTPAYAASAVVATNGADSVRLTDGPCAVAPVLAQVKPEFHSRLKAASAVIGGKTYPACWIPYGDSAHVLYEDGDQGLIPMVDFRPEGTPEPPKKPAKGGREA